MRDSILRLPHTVIFDFDRTLARLHPNADGLSALAGKIRGIFADLLPNLSKSQDGYLLWYECLRLADGIQSSASLAKAKAAAEEAVLEHEVRRAAVAPPVLDARDLFSSILSSGRQIGIASSNSAIAIESYLERANAADLVRIIVGRHQPIDLGEVKPEPTVLLMAAEALDAEPGRCAYVGDDVVDMQAACRAGMSGVGVTTGDCSKGELDRAGALIVFDSAAQLTQLL